MPLRKSFYRSMSSEHQRLQRQDDRLQTKDQCVNESNGIDDVQIDLLQPTDTFGRKFIVVIGINICDAAASRRHAVQSTLIERIEPCQNGAGRANLLHLGELGCSKNLSGSNHVLYLGDDKGDDGHRFADARRLADHTDLEHLRLDLIEACKKSALSGTLRNED